jgi:hypothetical protein
LKTIRVFPRRTNLTPVDGLVAVDCPPGLFHESDAVHISVAFTYDLPRAEWLEKQWRRVAPVSIGGPAIGVPGGDFVPGMYVKDGATITSRGCPNRCWFCSVWKREGGIRELPVQRGYNILDDNLLACSPAHIAAVFAMLSTYPKRTAEFTGGLEAKLLTARVAEMLFSVRPKTMYFAYDTPDDADPLNEAGKLLWSAGFKKGDHNVRCYVLCGFPKDTMTAAEERMRFVLGVGMSPMAMLWRGADGKTEREWRRFQRAWVRPTIIYAKSSIPSYAPII